MAPVQKKKKKNPQNGWLMKSRNLFLTVLKAGVSKINVLEDMVFLVHR